MHDNGGTASLLLPSCTASYHAMMCESSTFAAGDQPQTSRPAEQTKQMMRNRNNGTQPAADSHGSSSIFPIIIMLMFDEIWQGLISRCHRLPLTTIGTSYGTSYITITDHHYHHVAGNSISRSSNIHDHITASTKQNLAVTFSSWYTNQSGTISFSIPIL